jgi:hypothetical protein
MMAPDAARKQIWILRIMHALESSALIAVTNFIVIDVAADGSKKTDDCSDSDAHSTCKV